MTPFPVVYEKRLRAVMEVYDDGWLFGVGS
jgi:hypothetical protein